VLTSQSSIMLLIIVISLLPFVFTSPHFWITSEIVNIEWKEDCLTTRECSLPRFEISHSLKSTDIRVLQSLSVSERTVQDSTPFVSSWSIGSSEEISISASVMGIDPVYAFPRVCDSTISTRPFIPGDISSRFRRVSISERDVKTIEISGRCFTATIEVRRHTERCPWCPEEIIIEKNEKEMEKNQNVEEIDDKIILISMAAIILILLITVIVLIICFSCKKSPVRSPAPSGVFRPSTKSPNDSMTSSGIFSISGSSINTTLTIHGSPIENEYDSIKGDSPSPSLDCGFPV
ncbi:hypothetical protein PRIPAC_73489, partial [Pristionchus pacificus]